MSNDYERLRLENIKRNDEFLSSLGLDKVKSELVPLPLVKNNTGKKRKKKLFSNVINPSENAENVRRSKRLDPTIQLPLNDSNLYTSRSSYTKIPREYREININFNADEEAIKRKEINFESLRLFISEMNEEHSDYISDQAIHHCIHRLKSMSNNALATRLKMISRGHGEKSREKLLVFYYCLKLSGLNELEEGARQILEESGIVFT